MAKILIVDDRPTNRQLLLTLLGYVGHTVIEASNGVEANTLAIQHHPDLIITDILMPTMSGFEFVQLLRADPELQHIPVIFYTASYSEPRAWRLAQACGVQTVLLKPCDPELILAAVNRTLNLDQPIELPQAAQPQLDRVAREALLAEGFFADFLRNLNKVKSGFAELIESNAHTTGDLAQQQQLTDTFSSTIANLTSAATRLSTLVQAGLDLLQERDANHVVSMCFDAACAVMSSSYAAIGIFDETSDSTGFVLTKGLDKSIFAVPDQFLPPPLREMFSCRQPVSVSAAPGQYLEGFVPPHPPVKNCLVVPVATTGQLFGWMYFADRLGNDEFNAEDRRVATTLAIQLALLRENFLLYDQLQSHAVQLQLEVSERREVEKQLLELNESLEARVAERTAELQAANHELEAYSYSVSHDLRAPLRTIDGFTQLLRQDEQANSSGTERMTLIQHIDTSVKRTMAIIDALLRLSQLNRQPIQRETVDVAAVVTEVFEQLRMQEPIRSVELRMTALPQCSCDASMLKQVYANLLSNAFKFSGKQLQAVITVGWQLQPEGGVYYVADNGVGFKAEHAKLLFVAFQRAHLVSDFEGTGIGLSIVQRIVQRHGGRIWAESSPGAGATFYFTMS